MTVSEVVGVPTYKVLEWGWKAVALCVAHTWLVAGQPQNVDARPISAMTRNRTDVFLTVFAISASHTGATCLECTFERVAQPSFHRVCLCRIQIHLTRSRPCAAHNKVPSYIDTTSDIS